MAKQNKPAIRFKGFTDAWEQRKLGEIATFINGRAYSQPELLSSGKYKVLRVGNFYTNDSWYYSDLELGEKYYADYGDLLYTWSATFGPHIWLGDRVIYHYHIWKINLSDQLEKQFAVQLLEQDRTNILSSKNGSTMVHITKEGMEQKDVIIPPSTKEQQEIGAFFLQLDNLITLHQRKYDKLQVLKKAMLEKMFPKNGSSVPEIRFKGFTDAWEQRKVSEVAEICAGGTPSTGIEKYWHPKEIPWLSSGEVHKKYITYTDNKISVEGLNNSSARMIPANSVLIALAGQGKTRGTVAINRISLTTNQSIAAMIFTKEIVPEFVFCNLENRYEEIRRMSSGDGSRGGLNKQIVGEIEIPYTSKEEQAKIGAYFSKLDYLITLHQRELEKLQNIKKSMLEKMFV